jgi:hypothetical protein
MKWWLCDFFGWCSVYCDRLSHWFDGLSYRTFPKSEDK